MSTPDPLDSAIPVGSGPGNPVPPPTQPAAEVPPPSNTPPPTSVPPPVYSRATPSGSDKAWVILSHLAGFLGVPIILPLIVYLAMKNESAYVAENARESLNFHLSWLIYSLCCIPLTFVLIGVPLLILLGLAAIVLAIIAAVKAADGGCYRYPLTLRLVK